MDPENILFAGASVHLSTRKSYRLGAVKRLIRASSIHQSLREINNGENIMQQGLNLADVYTELKACLPTSEFE